MLIDHKWIKQEKGFWQCEMCAKWSRTRRKPKMAGCTGREYTDEELSAWRFGVEVVANGGTNLMLLQGEQRRCIKHLGTGFEIPASEIRQYVDWLNRRLDAEQRISEILRGTECDYTFHLRLVDEDGPYSEVG